MNATVPSRKSPLNRESDPYGERAKLLGPCLRCADDVDYVLQPLTAVLNGVDVPDRLSDVPLSLAKPASVVRA
jgi:hypothetical protein